MTKEIALTRGMFAIVDDSDYEWLMQWKWYAIKPRKTWYAARKQTQGPRVQNMIYMHRVILNAPSGKMVDHCDGNGLNNARSNIRLCSNAENHYNQFPVSGKSSKYKGVCWNKRRGKWNAVITANGIARHLGVFEQEADAAVAYNKAALELHGEFARLNRVSEMTAEEKFALMLTAMMDDDWVALVEDEIAREDSIEWLFAQDEADDYEDFLADVEFIRGGC